jgi:hypothetical protein
MSGADKTAAHHGTRNRLYIHARGAGAVPVLEAADVLNVLGIPGAEGAGVGGGTARSRERPADVLLCRAQDVRVGAAGGTAVGRVALDVGIVCPQAAVHLDNAQGCLGAAEAYTRTKCDRAQMAERCRVAGVVFQPMIFESLGGVSVEAERVIKSLNRMVAENQDTPYGEVATRFWQRLSIDLQRAGHRAFSRRVARGKDLEGEGMGVFSGSGVFLTEAEGSLHA